MIVELKRMSTMNNKKNEETRDEKNKKIRN